MAENIAEQKPLLDLKMPECRYLKRELGRDELLNKRIVGVVQEKHRIQNSGAFFAEIALRGDRGKDKLRH
jgi:hypothetical protein